MTPAISVIVPTRNKARYLELTLASWRHQRFRDYELVIIDDGSSDDTAAVVAAFRDRLPIRVVAIEHGGRARARNRGLAVAEGATIVFTDDDRIVHPDFLAAHVAALDGCSEPSVIIGWQHGLLTELRPQDAVVIPSSQAASSYAEVVARGEARWTMSATDLDEDLSIIEKFAVTDIWFQRFVLEAVQRFGDDLTACPLAWAYGTTGNLAVRRELLDRVGGFDEYFDSWGLEDTELHYRCVAAGARTALCREAINYHQNHPRDPVDLDRQWSRNARRLLSKHETLEVAIYIQAQLTSLTLDDACAIVMQARSDPRGALVRAYRRVLFNDVRVLLSFADMA